MESYSYRRGCKYDIDSIVSLFSEDQIDVMYKLFDDAAEKHLIKKTVYDKDNTKKGNSYLIISENFPEKN